MVQENEGYRINKKENKEIYLKYFPVEEGRKGLSEAKEKSKDGQKTCIYCGSIHVPQHSQESYEVCGDCCAQLLCSKQEFEDALCQTRKSLEQLIDISIDRDVSVVYKRSWLQQRERYFSKPKKEKGSSGMKKKRGSFGKRKEARDGFGKNFVGMQKSGKTITFIVYERMPRSIFAYLTAGYMIGAFLEKEIPSLSGTMAYRPMKYAMMKWCALHYMYLDGYMNFCQWKDREESEDVEYKELKEEIGSPLKNSRKDRTEILDVLKEKIAAANGKEEQEKPNKEHEEIKSDDKEKRTDGIL